jgi:hypothetical protein
MVSVWCNRMVHPLSCLSTCVSSRAHLNVYLANLADFEVKFCITLEVSRILRQNLAEMWNNYIQMNRANTYF